MSERGSFATEYVFCSKCFKAAQKVLLDDQKFLDSVVIRNRPIIAGKIGGSYPGDELDTFRDEFNPELEKTLCHPMRIAVMAESGEQIFHIKPETGDE